MMHQKNYISIEGNIGAGKSTFIRTFTDILTDVQWVTQPVQQWRNLGQSSYNVLQHYYQNPSRWGLTFQLYAIATRIRKLTEALNTAGDKNNIIMQRSPQADKRVFSKLMKKLEYMNPMQYQIFRNLYPETIQKSHKIIYLKCNPEACSKRIQLRNRQEQASIPIQYLKLIHQLHEEWISVVINEHQLQNNVLVIDSQINYFQEESKRKEIADKIKLFLGVQDQRQKIQ